MPDRVPSEGSRCQPSRVVSRLGRWVVRAASVRGTSHQKTGQPCQDAHYWSIIGQNILVAAVADGAGAARLGAVGATTAAYTAVSTIRERHQQGVWPHHENAWRQYLTDAIQAAQAAIETEAALRQVSRRELATTLILVVATPDLVVAAQVGDGAAVVGEAGGTIIGLTVPQRGEYANETTFVISPEALRTVQLRLWRGVPADIAMFSDGLQHLSLSMPDGLPYAPFFRPFFRFMSMAIDAREAREQLEAFLRSRHVTARTDDDTTLLLANLAG